MKSQCQALAVATGERCQRSGRKWRLVRGGISAWVCQSHDDPHIQLHHDPPMPHLRIGATIKELRELRGWSQRELSRRSGVSRKTLASYESGDCNPTLKKLCALAEAFDAKASALLKDAGL